MIYYHNDPDKNDNQDEHDDNFDRRRKYEGVHVESF